MAGYGTPQYGYADPSMQMYGAQPGNYVVQAGMAQPQPAPTSTPTNLYGSARPVFSADGKGQPYSALLNTMGEAVANTDISYDTSSKDPAMIRARLFVGNINKVGVVRDDLIGLFKPFGRIIALAYFKGYAFVQFAEYRDADEACKKLHGLRWMGTILDVHLAVIGPQERRPRDDKERERDSRKRSSDDRERDQRVAKSVKEEFSEVSEINKLNRESAMKDQTTNEDLAPTEMADTMICGQCRFVTCEYEAFKDHRIAGCARRKLDDEPKRIKCATCNQRFYSCWALLEHLTDFHRMMLFRLEDIPPEEMNQQTLPQMGQQQHGMGMPMQGVQMGMGQPLQQQQQQQGVASPQTQSTLSSVSAANVALFQAQQAAIMAGNIPTGSSVPASITTTGSSGNLTPTSSVLDYTASPVSGNPLEQPSVDAIISVPPQMYNVPPPAGATDTPAAPVPAPSSAGFA